MKYRPLFRPLLSYGAHAALAATTPGSGGVDAGTVYAGLERLVAEALSHRTAANAEYFDESWFAAAAWLDEKLAQARITTGEEAGPRFQRRYFDTANAGEEFFERLDKLVERWKESRDPEIANVIDVYVACIDLGFLGKYYLPEERHRLDECRQRCLDAIGPERVDARRAGLLGEGPASGAPAAKPAGMWALWCVPVVVTLGLFVLYRLLLSSIYNQIVQP